MGFSDEQPSLRPVPSSAAPSMDWHKPVWFSTHPGRAAVLRKPSAMYGCQKVTQSRALHSTHCPQLVLSLPSTPSTAVSLQQHLLTAHRAFTAACRAHHPRAAPNSSTAQHNAPLIPPLPPPPTALPDNSRPRNKSREICKPITTISPFRHSCFAALTSQMGDPNHLPPPPSQQPFFVASAVLHTQGNSSSQNSLLFAHRSTTKILFFPHVAMFYSSFIGFPAHSIYLYTSATAQSSPSPLQSMLSFLLGSSPQLFIAEMKRKQCF